MKQEADRFTPDLLGPPRRGRPRKPNALTPAERARRYRANKRAARRPCAFQPGQGSQFDGAACPLCGKIHHYRA